MILHVLPGDAIAEEFSKAGFEGDTVICRECLVEGPVDAANLHDFWKQREDYLHNAYPRTNGSYAETVVNEFGRMIELPAGSEVNLWFEHELFCQVNLWFCLYLLRDTNAEVFRVFPSVREKDEIWAGFGCLNAAGLHETFSHRVKLSRDDITLGSELWIAYRSGDTERLRALAASASERSFPFLGEVCEAEAFKNSRPREVLEAIVRGGASDFNEIFSAFSRKAGIYGYGDAQVKRLLEELPD